MGQSNCGRTAAAVALMLLGLPPAFAMDRLANDQVANDWVDDRAAGGVADARPCPTRFDYVVLASFADAPQL